jgi:hypothetical protein
LPLSPLVEEPFDLEKAKAVIKEEHKDDITFVGQHDYFEDILDTIEQRVGNLQLEQGTLYIYIKGENSKKRIERNLLNIVLHVDKIFIIGSPADWSFNDPRIQFLGIEEEFEPNHQRFLVFNSPSYNVALVARHVQRNGNTEIEAALSNKKEAVSYISQLLAPFSYKKQF